jgi:YfiH family protein
MSHDFTPFIKSKFPGLFLAMSHRKDGNMKLGQNPEKDKEAFLNRRTFFSRTGIPEDKVISVNSIHGSRTAIVERNECGKFIDGTDGLTTVSGGVYLTITVADCLPVIIYSPVRNGVHAVCLLHCGWKGLAGNIIEKAIFNLKETFGIKPSGLLATAGPGIGKCHYSVNSDFMDNFAAFPAAFQLKDGKLFADIKYIAKRQLEESGLYHENIYMSPVCTYCQSDKYFSHRKDKTEPVDAMIVAVGLK